jgi:transcription antitermination factor NusG
MKSDLWYALKVRPRFERTVVAHLRSRGYDPFLPCYSVKRKWTDRVKSIELPLFPGYVFCQFDVNARFPIVTTPGVSFIVGAGRVPQAIAEEEVESIRAVVNSGLHYEPYPYLNVGQLVLVEQGALAGLAGLITDFKNGSRLIISINLLRRSVSAEIDRSWVTPIDRSCKQYRYLEQAFPPPPDSEVGAGIAKVPSSLSAVSYSVGSASRRRPQP